MVQAQELLANITLLEVAVLKLEEQSSILQNEVGQARTEREIAELRHSSADSTRLGLEGSNLRSVSSHSNGTVRLPSSAPDSQIQHFTAAIAPTSMKTTALEACIPPGNPALGLELESQKPQKVYFDKSSRNLAFSCPL